MKFFLNTNFIIKRGCSLNFFTLIKDNVGLFNQPMVVYDAILENQSYFKKIITNLKINFPKINFIINDQPGEPTYQYLNKISNNCKNKNIDLVIAIGGGSTMDIGKGISFLLTNPGNALQYKGFPKNVNKPIPLITCPSLFGSGADISYNAVFIDEKENRKLGINSIKNFPQFTIIDSELTMEAPESVVISSAMDTLVHCIDSFGSIKHTAISRMYSIQGFQHTFNVLLNNNHMDINFRNELALGSICGITALMNSGDGPTNGFAYYLGVKYNVPHGLAGAIFLKEVIKYNIYQKNYLEYVYLLSGKSLANNMLSKNKILLDLMDKFETLYKNLNIPNLSHYNFTKHTMNDFVSGSMDALAGSFGGNPVKFDKEAVKHVYNNLIMEQ